MGLETATYINSLVETNPVANDPKNQGDDHIRLLKSALKNTFPNIGGAVTVAATELNYLDGCTQNVEDRFDGIDATKANLNSPALTGTPTTPTADTGTTGTQIASLDFVIATALSASLPGQTGNAGKFISTDGTNGFWSSSLDTSIVKPAVGTDLATTTGTQTLSSKTYKDPTFADGTDATKKLTFNLTRVGTATERIVDVYDEDVLLFTPGWRLLATVTASSSATADIEGVFSSSYDNYVIEAYDVRGSINAQSLQVRFKKAGSYLTGNVYTYRSAADSVLTGQTSITLDLNISSGTGEQNFYRLTLVKPLDTGKSTLLSIQGANTFNNTRSSSMGSCTTTGAVQGVRFMMASGNLTTGTFKIYGIRKT